jgi:lipopolysaccharide export system protein LptA
MAAALKPAAHPGKTRSLSIKFRQHEMILVMCTVGRNLRGRIVRSVYGIAVVLTAIAAPEAGAQKSAPQGVPNAVQGFSQNRDQPIQIEAASLEMRDKKKEATFAGNVKVVQGDTTMTSKTLVAFYDSTAAPASAANSKAAPKSTPPPMHSTTPGPCGSSSIRRLEAKGSVVVTQKDQVVTGETAVFDTRSNLITVLGEVVLTQCRNILRGDRLLVDMTTGVSRIESDSGKVQVLFDQSGQGCGTPVPGSGTPAPSFGLSNKPK